MNRREFHLLVAAGMAASPLAVAQQDASAPAARSIGFVAYGTTAAGVTTAIAAPR